VFACIKVDFAGKFLKFFMVRYLELKTFLMTLIVRF
jgi:hypothetical protein